MKNRKTIATQLVGLFILVFMLLLPERATLHAFDWDECGGPPEYVGLVVNEWLDDVSVPDPVVNATVTVDTTIMVDGSSINCGTVVSQQRNNLAAQLSNWSNMQQAAAMLANAASASMIGGASGAAIGSAVGGAIAAAAPAAGAWYGTTASIEFGAWVGGSVAGPAGILLGVIAGAA